MTHKMELETKRKFPDNRHCLSLAMSSVMTSTQLRPIYTEHQWLISLYIRSMWETICDAQAHSCTHSSNSKFLSKFSRKPLSGISDQKVPPPHFGKLHIWDDQGLLQNTPPISENFRFEMMKVYSEIPPPISENFRFEMTKVYSEIPLPPISENFRFEMTKVYSKIPPHSLAIREIVCGD